MAGESERVVWTNNCCFSSRSVGSVSLSGENKAIIVRTDWPAVRILTPSVFTPDRLSFVS